MQPRKRVKCVVERIIQRRQTSFVSLVVFVCLIYFWHFNPYWPPKETPRPNFYDRLSDSFLSARLDLPRLKEDNLGDNCWFDASKYENKCYIYFGPTPVLFMWLPVKFLFGVYPDYVHPILLFQVGAFVFSAAILYHVFRNCFDHVPEPVFLCTVAIAGLGVPHWILQKNLYSVPQITGVFFFIAGTYLLLKFLPPAENVESHIPFLSSLSLGLAVWSRTVFAPAVLVTTLLLVLFYLRFWRSRIPASTLRWFVLALFLSLSIQSAYNYLRFDNPLETGIKYQRPQAFSYQRISIKHIKNGVWFFALRYPAVSQDYPYIRMLKTSVFDPPQFGEFRIYGGRKTIGFIYCTPLMLVLVLFPPPAAYVFAKKRRLRSGLKLVHGLFAALVLSISCASILSVYLVIPNYWQRYLVDFTYFGVLSACILWLLITDVLLASEVLHKKTLLYASYLVLFLFAAYSVAFNLLLSLVNKW
jgi:hypothetical protein